MSGGVACKCDEGRKPLADRPWVVTCYHGNYSAFNGYRFTPSDYSAIRCEACGTNWRTKADYVYSLKAATK